jgi:hypothetical protein
MALKLDHEQQRLLQVRVAGLNSVANAGRPGAAEQPLWPAPRPFPNQQPEPSVVKTGREARKKSTGSALKGTTGKNSPLLLMATGRPSRQKDSAAAGTDGMERSSSAAMVIMTTGRPCRKKGDSILVEVRREEGAASPLSIPSPIAPPRNLSETNSPDQEVRFISGADAIHFRSGRVYPFRDPQNTLRDEEHIVEVTTRWVRVLCNPTKAAYSVDGVLLEPRSAEVFPGHSEDEDSYGSDTSASEDETERTLETILAWPRTMVVLTSSSTGAGIEADEDRKPSPMEQNQRLCLLGFDVMGAGLFFFQCSEEDGEAFKEVTSAEYTGWDAVGQEGAPAPPPPKAAPVFL